MKHSIVAIAKEPTAQDMVEKVFELLGGKENLIKKNSTVVIKPNAGHAAPPETSVNTSPDVLRAVIRTVRSAGAKRVIVAEASAIGCDTMNCFEVSGQAAVAQEEGVELLDIKNAEDTLMIPIRDAYSNITKLKVPRVILEAEHVINLPIFKTHASMVFTGALKNIKGVVDDKVHYQMHQQNLPMAMMDVWSVIKCDLSIIDMIRPAGGYGPHTTVPMDLGVIVGSKDPVAADAVACSIVGLGLDKVSYFNAARERGLGTSDPDEIEIRGRSVEEVHKNLWLPYIQGFDSWPEYTFLKENSCSSCQALVALSMEKLKALGEYEKNAGTTIVLGAKKELPEGLDPHKTILCGNCTKKFRDRGYWIEGCPPGEVQVAWTIIDRKNWEVPSNMRERMEEESEIWEKYVQDMARKMEEASSAEKQ